MVMKSSVFWDTLNRLHGVIAQKTVLFITVCFSFYQKRLYFEINAQANIVDKVLTLRARGQRLTVVAFGLKTAAFRP
jgi:hypothetical protein